MIFIIILKNTFYKTVNFFPNGLMCSSSLDTFKIVYLNTNTLIQKVFK